MAAYGQFACHYDRLMAEMPYPLWLSFLHDCWHRCGINPRTLVDLGCGTGSLALPLAQQGLQVTGIDLSADMLAVAQAKTEQLRKQSGFPDQGSVRWMEQDMREWELPAAVNIVYSFCDCLNYLLEEDELRRAFRQTHAGLTPDGLFVFDMHSIYQLEMYAKEQPFIFNEEDLAYIWTCDYDPVRCQIGHDLTFFMQDNTVAPSLPQARFQRFAERHEQRAYPQEWLTNELQLCGFDVLAVCADFSWSPPIRTSDRLFFVARKQ